MSFDELQKQFVKDYGDRVGGLNFDIPDLPRLPTGWFPLDLSLGGGIPSGRYTEIFGREGSGKSIMAMKLIAMNQKLNPEKKNAYFDFEGTFETAWAEKNGVDMKKLYFYRPDYAEAGVDMIEGLLCSPECGIVVVDSVAMMMGIREVEGSAEKANVGGNSRVVSDLMRKAVGAFTRAEKMGNHPTLIGINQIRYKIGVTYGSNETSSGGKTREFVASTIIRLWGKDKKDPRYHKDLAVAKEVSFIIKKNKFPIVCSSGDMEIAVIPHKGLKTGECDDFPIVKQYMEKYGLLEKKGTKWIMAEVEYQTLKDVRRTLRDDVKRANEIKNFIIQKEVQASNGSEEEDETEEAEVEVGESKKKKRKKKG